MDREKLYKFSLNKLEGDPEIGEVIDWIESSEDNRREFEALKNLWAVSGFASYQSYVGKEPGNSPSLHKKRAIAIYMKYAAIFIMAFLIGSISVYFMGGNDPEGLTWNEIIIPAGESAELYLSDGTHVWLNSNTELRYPAKFEGKKREIELTGEAYFDVSHNPDNPFFVQTRGLTVSVAGTSFNVQAFGYEDNVNVTLVEGKVHLQSPGGKLLSELSPGENALYDLKKSAITISKADTEFYTSWKEGYLVFRDEKLEDIARKFERWYNIKVFFEDDGIRQIKYTGTILKNKPIDQVFNILKYTAGIDYSIEIINNKPSIIHLKNKPM